MPDSIFQKWLTMRGYDQPVDENYVMGDLPYSPSSMAVAVNPKNLDSFIEAAVKATREYYKTHPGMGNSIIEAMSFMKNRYPRLMSLPRYISGEVDSPKALGQYAAGHNAVYLNPEKLTSGVADAVEILGHELSHAWRARRVGPKAFTKEIIEGVPYKDRTIEKLANQGAQTARKAYDKYVGMLFDDISF